MPSACSSACTSTIDATRTPVRCIQAIAGVPTGSTTTCTRGEAASVRASSVRRMGGSRRPGQQEQRPLRRARAKKSALKHSQSGEARRHAPSSRAEAGSSLESDRIVELKTARLHRRKRFGSTRSGRPRHRSVCRGAVGHADRERLRLLQPGRARALDAAAHRRRRVDDHEHGSVGAAEFGARTCARRLRDREREQEGHWASAASGANRARDRDRGGGALPAPAGRAARRRRAPQAARARARRAGPASGSGMSGSRVALDPLPGRPAPAPPCPGPLPPVDGFEPGRVPCGASARSVSSRSNLAARLEGSSLAASVKAAIARAPGVVTPSGAEVFANARTPIRTSAWATCDGTRRARRSRAVPRPRPGGATAPVRCRSRGPSAVRPRTP